MHYGNCVNEFFVSLARENFRKRREIIAGINSKEDAQKYVDSVRAKWQKIFSFPERTPLDAVTVKINHFPGYTVENLYFYSRPGFPVTANFYLPEKFFGKLPTLLFFCGHDRSGKATFQYRSVCIGLALKGFAAMIIDPVEQGERRQYTQFKNPVLRSLCGNHNLMGRQLALNGDWLGSWRVWDGIRALDYLESRPEVDAENLIISGNSGGGTLTALTAACDPRPKAAIPCCYITTWKSNIENELPVDIEQVPPLAMHYGLEMTDLLLAHPRHTLIIGQIDDVFDHRGTRESFADVQKINSLLGYDAKLFIGKYPHGYHLEDREATYEFLTRHFSNEISGKEPDFELPHADTTLVCNNSVSNIPGNRFIHEIAAENAAKIAAARPQRSKTELAQAVKEFFHLNDHIPHYRVLRCICITEEKIMSRFALETEKDRIMAILYRMGDKDYYHFSTEHAANVRLVIPNLDTIQEFSTREMPTDEEVYALDMRTIGALRPDGTDQPAFKDYYAPYQAEYHYASLGFLTGETILGGKIKDILSALQLLQSFGVDRITLEAHGNGCVPAWFAALCAGNVDKLELHDAPESFTEAGKITNRMTLGNIAPGILHLTDLH